ncbi:MAG TPA: right-handed parallel beta-helix repeat-containing protein [Thermoanaerobaculia bacterium]|nr:right-handed parallel beta-helix repeat-containing protein [Thermoanaerobaculia bacterium]
MRVARLVPAGVFLFCTALAQAATITVDCNAGGKVQTAIDAAKPGDKIVVSGVCNENLKVLDEVARITLDGQGSTTIHGPNSGANTILVAGRNITIQGFTISGGRNGVAVVRGAMALIDSNTIQESVENGINVAQHSFAGILNTTVQLNHDAGIRMLDSSFARIGFMDLAQPARGNTIRQNGAAGVLVDWSSGASLAANSISDNDGPGVSVTGASQAELAGNHIDGNRSDGVAVSQNSFVQLGDWPGLLNPPNDTTVPNAGFGFHCSLNSSASGFLATLDGAEGAKRFDGSCTNGLDRVPEDEGGAPTHQWLPMGRAPGQKAD